jgi:hypothetical protein
MQGTAPVSARPDFCNAGTTRRSPYFLRLWRRFRIMQTSTAILHPATRTRTIRPRTRNRYAATKVHSHDNPRWKKLAKRGAPRVLSLGSPVGCWRDGVIHRPQHIIISASGVRQTDAAAPLADRIDRLGDELASAEFSGTAPSLIVAVRSHQHNRQIGATLLDFAEQFQPVHARHV